MSRRLNRDSKIIHPINVAGGATISPAMDREFIIIHHTGAEERDTEQVRRYHRKLGWRDIGYNYVVEKNGLVAPGRPLDQPGAHCTAAGMNTRGIGVALIGNFEEHPPAPQQLEALLRLLGRLMGQYRIPPAGVLGHREVPGAATACPGRYFPLEQVRAKVHAQLNQPGAINGTAGPPQGSPPAVEQDITGSGLWIVQVGAFSTRDRAEQYAQKLRETGIEAFVRQARDIVGSN